MENKIVLTPIKDLYADCIDVSSTRVDWEAEIERVGLEDFEIAEAVECRGCGQIVVQTGLCRGDEQHRRMVPSNADCDCEEGQTCPVCIAAACRGNVPEAGGPQMNYFWVIPHEIDAEEVARKISHLSLCLVRFHDEWGFALTGGGMDLSWDIAEGYMQADCLPPARLELPAFSGSNFKKPRAQWVIAGSKASQTARISRARSALRSLKALGSK